MSRTARVAALVIMGTVLFSVVVVVVVNVVVDLTIAWANPKARNR